LQEEDEDKDADELTKAKNDRRFVWRALRLCAAQQFPLFIAAGGRGNSFSST
jgi:hypothetical protein